MPLTPKDIRENDVIQRQADDLASEIDTMMLEQYDGSGLFVFPLGEPSYRKIVITVVTDRYRQSRSNPNGWASVEVDDNCIRFKEVLPDLPNVWADNLRGEELKPMIVEYQ